MHQVIHNVVGVFIHFSHLIILPLSIQDMLFTIQKFMPTSLYLVIKKETRRSLLKNIQFLFYQPTAGAVRATGVLSAAARSRGKL